MTTPVSFISGILSQIYTAKQLDVLHLSIINLLDMIKDGEIDLVLEQNKKTAKQKKAFIQKIIDSLESSELVTPLQNELDAGNVDFFFEKHLKEYLGQLQHEAEKVVPVKLTTAIEFKVKDLRDMVDQLTRSLGKPTVLNISVDHSLIAGAIVQYGNYITDYSLKSRLEQFRKHWEEAVIERA